MGEELNNDPFEDNTPKKNIEAKISREGVQINITLFIKKKGKHQKPYMLLTDEGAAYIEELAGYGCTKKEIAARCGVSLKVLDSEHNAQKVAEAMYKGKNSFLTSIRVEQRRIMRKGSARMAIFLGKVYLGQNDNAQPETVPVSPLDSLAEQLKQYADDGGQDDD